MRVIYPIVTELKPVNGTFVLKAANKDILLQKVTKLVDTLGVKDCVRVIDLGIHPDRPVPTPVAFAKITIMTGKAKSWMFYNPSLNCLTTGKG